MKQAGIREVKANLSRLLREVAKGETVIVTDRGRPVAELGPPVAREGQMGTDELRYRRLVASGAVLPAAFPGSREWLSVLGKGQSRKKGSFLPKGSTQRLIDEDRGD